MSKGIVGTIFQLSSLFLVLHQAPLRSRLPSDLILSQSSLVNKHHAMALIRNLLVHRLQGFLIFLIITSRRLTHYYLGG